MESGNHISLRIDANVERGRADGWPTLSPAVGEGWDSSMFMLDSSYMKD